MIKIAHIVNPFTAETGSDLYLTQPITFKSMHVAKQTAETAVEVEFLSAQFADDRTVVPEGFRLTKNLDKWIGNQKNFKNAKKLPYLKDILERAYDESDADYIVYTNVDIGLYPNFYLKLKEFINSGHDAFIINRRRLPDEHLNSGDLQKIFQEKGKKHPGFDCFVFHRSLFPEMQLAGVCIGVPFIEITLSQNLFALATNFKLFENEVLTFHLGMEIYKRRAPMEYFWYNRQEFHKAEKLLWPKMSLKKFPYHNHPFLVRLLKWVAHPCIPTRLVIKLLLRRR